MGASITRGSSKWRLMHLHSGEAQHDAKAEKLVLRRFERSETHSTFVALHNQPKVCRDLAFGPTDVGTFLAVSARAR